MFGVSKVEEVTGLQVSMSTEMQQAMQRWLDEYQERPPWLDDATPKTLGIAGGIAEEVARLTLLEFEFGGCGTSPRAQRITEAMQRYLEDNEDDLEMALAVGGMFPKPYLKADGKIVVEWITQDRVYPLTDEAGDVTGAVFVSPPKADGDLYYTRLEIHQHIGDRYTIENLAFSSNTLQDPFQHSIELTKVPDWEKLKPRQSWTNVQDAAFAVFRVPGKNKVDLTSPLGTSIFAAAEDLIADADRQYSRFLWEYDAKEAAVHIDGQAFRTTIGPDGKIKSSVPEGKDRLYRIVDNIGKIGDGGFYEAYSPDIRDTAFINGLNQILMHIENRCHLVRGTLSNDKLSESYTNELELKMSRNRGENTVARVKKAHSDCIKDLCMAINTMLDFYEGGTEASIDRADIVLEYGDSILVDDVSKHERMRQDVSDGLIPKWMYVREVYGMSEEDAKALVADLSSTAPEAGFFGP